MRFNLDKEKSEYLRKNPKGKAGFEEDHDIWEHPCYEDQRANNPEHIKPFDG